MHESQEVYLIRHGETDWSLNGRHTGISDIPLTDNGRELAKRWRPFAAAKNFALVLTSPLQRARQTCELAGLGKRAEVDGDLIEWNYGAYEGLTPAEIRAERPEWVIFEDGCPGGETPEQVGARVDRVIARARSARGDVAIFGHGHALRVLGARWLGLPAQGGRHFLLAPATLCVLTSYQSIPTVKRWNTPLMLRVELSYEPSEASV